VGDAGAVRDFLSAQSGLERWMVAHYVNVVSDPAGRLVAFNTCCDGADEAARMLRDALAAIDDLTAITDEVPIHPESRSVIVFRNDLQALLAGDADEATRARLRKALGEANGG
jgi:hypothetical protein